MWLQVILSLGMFTAVSNCKEPCYTQGLIPGCPYSDPVWYPDGSFVGFNHQVVKTIGISNPCNPFYNVTFYDDSNGFWMMKRDGTGMRRLINYPLNTPAWSPDGKWIAFNAGGQIFKMPFDGKNFDTLNIVPLTKASANCYYPTWSPKSDSIYFDSNEQNPTRPYQIHKMAADGTGDTVIGNKGPDSVYSRFPFCSSTNTIFHIRGDSLSTYIFSMNANGDQVLQRTTNVSPNIYITNPVSFSVYLFYQDIGIWRTNLDGSGLVKLCDFSSKGFSISKDGIIAYSNYSATETGVVDKTHGVIWIMNIDGSNQQPITFNNY